MEVTEDQELLSWETLGRLWIILGAHRQTITIFGTVSMNRLKKLQSFPLATTAITDYSIWTSRTFAVTSIKSIIAISTVLASSCHKNYCWAKKLHFSISTSTAKISILCNWISLESPVKHPSNATRREFVDLLFYFSKRLKHNKDRASNL